MSEIIIINLIIDKFGKKLFFLHILKSIKLITNMLNIYDKKRLYLLLRL